MIYNLEFLWNLVLIVWNFQSLAGLGLGSFLRHMKLRIGVALVSRLNGTSHDTS